MPCVWIRRFGLPLAALLAGSTLLRAALPTPAETPPRASLTGQLLVASPSITDPRFYQAVILLVRHDQRARWGSPSIGRWRSGHWRLCSRRQARRMRQ